MCQVKARGLVFAALATSVGERICDSPVAQRRPEWTDARSPRCHEQAEDRSGKQELELRRERARAMPAAAAVKELLSARAQRREHVLEVRCRSRKRTQGGRIERAASRGEEGDAREPASDLEAAAGDVLVRDAVCGEV